MQLSYEKELDSTNKPEQVIDPQDRVNNTDSKKQEEEVQFDVDDLIKSSGVDGGVACGDSKSAESIQDGAKARSGIIVITKKPKV